MFTRPQVRKTAQFCAFFQATLWPVVQGLLACTQGWQCRVTERAIASPHPGTG